MSDAAADWLVPDWPAPPGVHAACSTRAGGQSCGVWAGLNLGDHVGDEAAAVAANRLEAGAALQGAAPVYLKQVHGVQVARIGSHTPEGLEADACFTGERGVACTIMVADCLPVLFTTADGAVVGAAHAGWRGLVGGVLEATAEAIAREARVAPGTLLAWLGPCIGPRAFEVGGEVKAAFEAVDAQAASAFAALPAGKWLADLPQLARQRLARVGIRPAWGNDGSDAWCTVRNPSRFFSHRRDGTSGRFAAFVWRG